MASLISWGDMRRLTALAAVCALVVACGGVDQKKFDGVFKAGKALQDEVNSSGGGSASKERDLLKEFDTEINALRDHTIGIKEADALKAYADAADAYRYFLRFRAMDLEGDGRLVVLEGAEHRDRHAIQAAGRHPERRRSW